MKRLQAIYLLMFLSVKSFGEAAEMYPFGEAAGDVKSPSRDDACDRLYQQNIVLFGTHYGSIYVCTNGVLTLGAAIISYTPTAFPLAGGNGMIAAYWADADPRKGDGTVWSRVTTDPILLADVSNTVQAAYNRTFHANWALLATWEKVQAYGSAGEQENSFQVVLFSDGTQTYALYIYRTILWTAGTASSGVPAQVGFDAGNQRDYFAVTASRTNAISDIDIRSNIGQPGKWLFSLGEEGVLAPTINECADNLATCDVNAFCTDLEEGYNCTCNEGYGGDGYICYQPIPASTTTGSFILGSTSSSEQPSAGTLSAPHYPGHYPNNANINWTVRVEPGELAQVSFSENFVLEESSRCSSDKITIYDGVSGSLLFTICGNIAAGRTFVGTSHILLIVFVTDSSTTYPGWRLNWDSYSDLPASGNRQYQLTGDTGAIILPIYSRSSSPERVNLSWTVAVESGHFASIIFSQQINIDSAANCGTNRIEIYDGVSGSLLFTICGNIEANRSFVGISHTLIVVFVTDSSVTYPDWRLNWGSYSDISASGNQEYLLTGEAGEITLPNYPSTLSFSVVNISWTVDVGVGHVATITFPQRLNIELTDDCLANSIKIYDGVSGSLLFTICGNIAAGRTFVGTSHTLIIVFVTSSSVTYPDWRLTWGSITPLNECEVGEDNCHMNSTCADLLDGYTCTCRDGFFGDGENCYVDECQQGLHSCHRNATCHRGEQGHNCTCNTGFSGNGLTCYADETRCLSEDYEYNSYTQTCLRLVTNHPSSWVDAQSYCKAAGERLAIFDSLESIAWLKNLRHTSSTWGSSDLWVSGKRASDGKWRWFRRLTNDRIKVGDWGGVYPNNVGDCVEVASGSNLRHTLGVSYLWKSERCDERRNFICEREAN